MTIDRLSGLLSRFRVQAQLHHSGSLCGLTHFDATDGHGYLHVLRKGQLKITHPSAKRSGSQVPTTVQIDEPTLLFYPRPLTHQFHNPPREGSDFTCARLVFDGGIDNPLARALPPFMADRLFEVVVLQLLRWLLDHPNEAGIQPGLITGLSDPRLARVLVALHDEPGQMWSLERMADCAGMSRTAFATTFKEVLNQTPADYLADWRMALAQSRLREGRPIKQLAQELGYANPSALTRAFTARLGLSPRDWLKAQSV